MKYIAWILLALAPWSALASEELNALKAETGNSPWALDFEVSQVIGSGSFSQNEYIRQSSDYVGQTYRLGLSFNDLNVFEQSIRISIQSSADVEWTSPTHGGRRRFTLNDTRFSLSMPEIWREPVSGISIDVRASLSLPTSVSSYRVKKQILVASLGVGATGEWGIFSASMSLMASKYAGSRVGIHYGLRPAGCGLPTSARPEEFTPDCSAELIDLNEGFPNVSFALGAQSNLAVELFDHLSLSYGLGVRSYFKYAMVNDSFTSGNAQTGMAQRHYFNPSWTLSYPLSRKIELPVELSVFLDASAFHSTLRADRRRIFIPAVFNTFGKLAANGYGSLSLGVSGSW